MISDLSGLPIGLLAAVQAAYAARLRPQMRGNTYDGETAQVTLSADRAAAIAEVAALVELTARHGRIGPGALADDPDAANFLDCDMAILGAPPAVFDAYDRGIAAEYRGHVPGWLFALQRRRFLACLLAAPRIFLGDFFHGRLDAAARANLRRAVNGKR